MIAASPSLFRAWRFWASSAPPREAESDSFLVCAAKTKQRLGATHTRPYTPSLSSTNVVVSLGLREMLHYSDRKKGFDITYVIRGFPIGHKFVSFHQTESNSISSIHKKCIVSIQKCPSLIRARRNERNLNRCYYCTYCSVCGMYVV